MREYFLTLIYLKAKNIQRGEELTPSGYIRECILIQTQKLFQIHSLAKAFQFVIGIPPLLFQCN